MSARGGSYSSSSSPRSGQGRNGGTGSSGNRRRNGGKRAPSDWRVAGGPGRDHSVLIELELDKVHIHVSVLPKQTLRHDWREKFGWSH